MVAIHSFCRLFLFCLVLHLAACSNGKTLPPPVDKVGDWVPPPPVTTGFDAADPRKHMAGLCELTVDNSRNDFDVLAKLYRLDTGEEKDLARVFNLRTGESIRVKPILAGRYDLRFRNLATGDIHKTDPMDFEERTTSTGTEYSTVTFTLYAVPGGNTRTTRIPESEF